jgi:hypothetical protein
VIEAAEAQGTTGKLANLLRLLILDGSSVVCKLLLLLLLCSCSGSVALGCCHLLKPALALLVDSTNPALSTPPPTAPPIGGAMTEQLIGEFAPPVLPFDGWTLSRNERTQDFIVDSNVLLVVQEDAGIVKCC